MKFLQQEMQNFLAVGYGVVNLDDRGLCLIQGVNKDDTSATSNGVGKSTIPDALCWTVYGTTARGVSGDAVVNKTAKKDTIGRTHIKDGHTTYRITRYRKHSLYKNQLTVECWTDSDHTTINLTKGTEKETQEVINQIMGCSLEVFQAAIYAGQEEMPDLPKMTDKQLKLLIEEAAGVARLENAYAAALKKATAAELELRHLGVRRDSIKTSLDRLRVSLVEAQAKVQDFEKARVPRSQAFQNDATRIRKDMVGCALQLSSMDENSLRQRAAEIDAKLAEYNDLKDQQKDFEKLRTDAERDLAIAETNFMHEMAGVNQLRSDLANAAQAVKRPCNACGKPGDEHDLSTYKDHVAAALGVAATKAVAAKKKRDEALDVVTAAKRACDEFAATIPDMGTLINEGAGIARDINAVERLKNDLRLMKSEYDAALKNAAEVLSDPNPHQALVDHIAAEGRNGVNNLNEVESKIKLAEEELLVAKDVAKVFGPAGVRAHILDTVTPFLNDRTADYLSALSDGNITAVWSTLTTTAKGELKEKFNIEVTNSKGAESFAGLSGGEKRKVRLATMLALQDLVASRATKSIELYIADEIDDALDDAGLERLMGVLDRKAREKGTVLVISHNSLTDWISQVCTVTKNGGLSTIEGALT